MERKMAILVFWITLCLLSGSVLGGCSFSFDGKGITHVAPRTYHTNVVVGHHDGPDKPSQILAINQDGDIEIIKYPGGDTSHAFHYAMPHLSGAKAGQIPVLLFFADLNSDGHLDMIIQIQQSQHVLLNNKVKFIPVPAGEEKNVMQQLHKWDLSEGMS